jgi:hypothetical protein
MAKKKLNGVNFWTLTSLASTTAALKLKTPTGWVPCRPIGRTSIRERLRAAVMVFRGKADIIIWPAGQ